VGNMMEGENINLRPIIKEDIGFLNIWKNDEKVYKYLGGGFMPTSIDQQIKWMDSIMDTSGNNKRYIICKKEGTPVGMVGLYNINWIHRTVEIGIYIGDKTVRGKGYGKEACKLVEQFAKRYLNLRKIKLSVVSENRIAINMWKSLGYKEVGEYQKERFIDGRYMNLILMEKFIDNAD
jgi:RimJ/RimL family protein N-acetyltransferase